MKQLRNNFTTPKQSERLLALGLPEDSADCYLERFVIRNTWMVKILQTVRYSELVRLETDEYIPCWSVGRLTEICLKCSTLKRRQVRFFCNGDDDEYSLIDYIMTALESGVMTNHMDFSKLDDRRGIKEDVV